jgi:small subunit ribosomal protein S11
MAIRTKKKKYTKLLHAKLYVCANPNNTILSLTNDKGDVLTQLSCGVLGFNNCRKSTPHATQMVSAELFKRAIENHGVKTLEIITRGIGIGRELVLTAVTKTILQVTAIYDDTCVKYGGVTARRSQRK